MTEVLHVIDGSTDETMLQVLETLRTRLSGPGAEHAVCCVDPGSMTRAACFIDSTIESVTPRFRVGRHFNWTPDLNRIIRHCNPRVVHAWGIEAARVSATALKIVNAATNQQTALVLTLLDPAPTQDMARWLRSMPVPVNVVAGSQVIRSRLLSSGADPERVVVVRGPCDFGAINKAKESGLREKVVGNIGPVILLSGPPSRGAGHFFAVWAAGIVRQIYPDLTVIVPYDSQERRRLLRYVKSFDGEAMLTLPPPDMTWPELVSCADLFLAPAIDEICTEPFSAAMGGGVVVVASAVRSVAELVADKSNGLLSRDAVPRTLASRMVTALDDLELRKKLSEVARGQAFEVFGVRAFQDNYRQLYDNVIHGRPAGDQVRDTAMVA